MINHSNIKLASLVQGQGHEAQVHTQKRMHGNHPAEWKSILPWFNLNLDRHMSAIANWLDNIASSMEEGTVTIMTILITLTTYQMINIDSFCNVF